MSTTAPQEPAGVGRVTSPDRPPLPRSAAAGPHRVTLAGTGRSFPVAPGERIHAAARRAGIWLPFECGWGGCGTCKATLVEGEVEQLFPDAPARDSRDERRRRILLCQTTPRTDLVVKPLRVEDVPPVERPTTDHRARLAAVEQLSPDVARFRFDLVGPDGAPTVAVYRPGQFAVLELAPGVRRCYSMAGLPGSGSVEFLIRHRPGGPGTDRLFGAGPDEEFPLELPYGDLWLRRSDRPAALVAGGTGISAALALLHELADSPGTTGPVEVFYGAATRTELVCWDEVAALVGRIPGARLHGALVDPDPAWTGTRGLVTQALAERLPDLVDAHVYLAGPPPMARAVQTLLGDHGIELDRTHVDAFG